MSEFIKGYAYFNGTHWIAQYNAGSLEIPAFIFYWNGVWYSYLINNGPNATPSGFIQSTDNGKTWTAAKVKAFNAIANNMVFLLGYHGQLEYSSVWK